MNPIHVYSYVEDAPSREVLIKLVQEHNRSGGRKVEFKPGFPRVTPGVGNIRKMCGAFLNMAATKQHTLVLTDLDAHECPATLIRDWFFPDSSVMRVLPPQVVFRVAVREVESWLMADKDAFARFLGVASANFAGAPEMLSDPKQSLLNVLRHKATKKKIRDMIPTGRAHIGPTYNENLCEFITTTWSVERACANAPSLRRALSALGRV
jgi:hypothetical protein